MPDRLKTDPDYITLKRFNCSLEELLKRYDGKEVPDKVIANALDIEECDVPVMYARVVAKLQRHFKVEE